MIEAVSQWVEHIWAHPVWSDPAFFNAAVLLLFSWAFLAATVLSVPSEAAYLLLTAHYPASLPLLWGVASLGNFLGGCTTFWMGIWLAQRKPLPISERVHGLLLRWGGWALFASSIPVLGDAMVLAAGYLRLPLLPCMVSLFVGKAARYAMLSSFTA
jgi:membrane protein YqaA with SNARE-associated domain